MTEAPRAIWKSRAVLVGVFLLFFLPILLSWYLVFFTNYKHGGGVEHGILITPAQLLPDVTLTEPVSGQETSLYGKWTMLSRATADCDEACRDNFYRMRQIRLATGKEMGRLQRITLFSGERTTAQIDNLFREYEGHLLLIESETDPEFVSTLTLENIAFDGGIYLIDPAGFLMMYYPAATEPGGIIKDLKRLLRISKLD